LESITCPGCQKPIRVPPDVLGQRAQCPFCKSHFQAPVRTADGTLTTPTLVRRNPFGQSRTFGPGAALIFVGLLGVITNTVQVVRAYADPDEFERQVRRDLEQMNLADYVERTIRWMPMVRAGFLILSALVFAGGVATLRKRRHGLAMLGSLGALFNVASCCCVLGFPAGAWALYVLKDPQVRAQFDQPTGPETTAPPA
jgi:hypothetical protein